MEVIANSTEIIRQGVFLGLMVMLCTGGVAWLIELSLRSWKVLVGH